MIFVDCEAYGPCPSMGRLTEFGAVDYHSLETFHGVIVPSDPSAENPAIPRPRVQMSDAAYAIDAKDVFTAFDAWIQAHSKGRAIFVSDNPAFDWQWINDGLWKYTGRNLFGHSARRISDYYAGLVGNWSNTQKWKRLRVTKHDHNPVHDALGNVEAFRRLQNGER